MIAALLIVPNSSRCNWCCRSNDFAQRHQSFCTMGPSVKGGQRIFGKSSNVDDFQKGALKGQ